jgi:hypothetical protein
VDPTNPQSWNRYVYALNNPLSNKDPLGLECVWDDGSYDSADDPDSGSPGTCAGLGGSWVDHSYFQQNGMADWNGSANSDLADLANHIQNPDTTVFGTPCPAEATTRQRVTQGIQGVLNIAIGEAKTYGYGTLGLAGIAGIPPSGGLSLLATGVAAYGVVTSQGQVTSGLGQLVTAFGGNPTAGRGIQQVGDIVQGPLLGVPTLGATNNATTAQRAANIESYVTAGTGFVNSTSVTNFIQGAVDWGLSTIGVTGNFSDSGCD